MSRKALIMVVFAALMLIGGGAYVLVGPDKPVTANGAVPAALNPASGSAAVAGNVSLDIDRMMAVRGVGNPDAPVTVEEFASLTCSHCATFYKDTYPKLKADYIDTGKVYFIYTDFPLNAPALDAAMVARCLPDQHYFNFIKMLFENQNSWAFSEQYRQILQHNAAMLGMSTEYFESCLGSTALREGLAKRMQEASSKHDIRSTPSFLINGSAVIGGAVSYDKFKEVLDALLPSTGEN